MSAGQSTLQEEAPVNHRVLQNEVRSGEGGSDLVVQCLLVGDADSIRVSWVLIPQKSLLVSPVVEDSEYVVVVVPVGHPGEKGFHSKNLDKSLLDTP